MDLAYCLLIPADSLWICTTFGMSAIARFMRADAMIRCGCCGFCVASGGGVPAPGFHPIFSTLARVL
jgi:homoaconitase/3-isopropylmalate dehydratase large subunit